LASELSARRSFDDVGRGTPAALVRADDVGQVVERVPTRAVLVTELFPPAVGGTARLFAEIYGRLGRTPVTVITHGVVSDPSTSNRSAVVRIPGWGKEWGLLNPTGLRHHLRRMNAIRRHAAGHPCVVHCGRALPEAFDALLARRLTGVPYICWAHGEELAYAVHSREIRALMKAAYRQASLVFANSRSTAERVEDFGVRRDRVVVVHPGVDSTVFRPDAPGSEAIRARLAEAGDVVLLTVGRLQRRKGHDQVLQVVARLRRSGLPVRYVVVGDGEERERLHALTRQLGLDDRVTFVGQASSTDLPGYYAAADVFVHPNRVDDGDFEGFGIVFLEAAASGLPTVGGASGGAPEAVQSGVTGLLVSGTDLDELESSVTSLVVSPERRRAMGGLGRTRVASEFSWECAAERVAVEHERVAAARWPADSAQAMTR
jgi:phosphatidylinositol alpha-1,6-mannosyltransferase